MTIAILCPTRGRPEPFRRMVDSAFGTSERNVYIYSGSNGGDGYADTQYPMDMPTCHMWNDLARQALENESNRFFMLGADDMLFATPGWDRALQDHYAALENKIFCYALQDSRDLNGTPHPIVTREWIGALGYFMPPLFMHWQIDSWTVGVAKEIGCFAHMKEFLLIHDKPSDRGQPDETHNHIRCMGWAQRDAALMDSAFGRRTLCHETGRLRLKAGTPRFITVANDSRYVREQA